MNRYGSKARIFVLIGILFITIASVYAETADEYFNNGVAHYDQGNFTQAISDYTTAIKINPNDAQAYYNRGVTYFKGLGNVPQAIFDYNKAIEINPNYAKAYYGRVLAYFVQKDFAKAWEDVHKAESLGVKIDLGFIEDLKKASGRDK